ncbi:unnamed protein product [Lepeophtheirus salmonis]|uniref:(salmon louse) hypothetical protein n=1 Tax=Lepeophtheirus salmonis TaxID=72036 RepID=A0A7R8H406_LEPSM|nr:unnamed protein product [Lepeophtheirus salmonis]CAF2853477.1 unnamed protein product [Lepeophtheirus salmonis]
MDKGILADPNPKRASGIDEHVAQDVIHFYKSEYVSRRMPGQTDTVSLYKNRAKIKEQNHLILYFRPKECVLVGSNVRLQSLYDFLIILQCNPPSIECCLCQCGMCGDEIKIKNILSQILELNMIDEITYRRWTHTVRSQPETLLKSSQDFVEDFTKSLQKYQPPAFITKNAILQL